MAISIFDDKSKPPTPKDVAAALGAMFTSWCELQKSVEDTFALVTAEWGYASKSTGWGMRLKQKDRVILYMTPCRGYFLVSFVLGEKAVTAAHAAELPKPVLETIDAARKYAEGRGVRFEIRKAADLRIMEELASIKMDT